MLPFGREKQSQFSSLAVLARLKKLTGKARKRCQREDESVTKYFNKARKEMMGERAQSARYVGTTRVRMEGRFRGPFSVAAAQEGCRIDLLETGDAEAAVLVD